MSGGSVSVVSATTYESYTLNAGCQTVADALHLFERNGIDAVRVRLNNQEVTEEQFEETILRNGDVIAILTDERAADGGFKGAW